MEKIMTYDNLRRFCYVNDGICKKPIKGIIISFMGLGFTGMFEKEIVEGEFYGEKGILYVVPYNNPWSWMNKQAVAYTDEIVDVLIDKYELSKDIPIALLGLSMGGQSAFVYSAYSKHTPVACVTNCPVCDVVFHFTERNDLPRTFYSSVFNEEGTFEEALKNISPLHIVDKLPEIKYYVLHCNKDDAVNIDAHSEKLVKALKEKNYDVIYEIVDGRGHCDITLEKKLKVSEFMVKNIEG